MIGAPSRTAVVAMLVAGGFAACSEPRPPRAPETVAVERKAGDFADYYAEVLRLATRHASDPDSFRAALDALPGSHLSEAEWRAWAAPYGETPGELATKLEEAIATVAPAEGRK
jgi:hypothetical protein